MEMNPDVYNKWKKIENTSISSSGDFVCYRLTQETGNESLHIYNTRTKRSKVFPRASNPQFTFDGSHIVFKINPDYSDVRKKKFDKVKNDKLPKDTLAIYNLLSGSLEKFPNIKSYNIPDKWDSYVFVQIPGSTAQKKNAGKKKQKNKLLIINTDLNKVDTLHNISTIELAKESKTLVVVSEANESLGRNGNKKNGPG